MNAITDTSAEIPTLDAERYISRDFAAREKAHLWNNVWQVACREEDLPTPGTFYTYEIADESIVLTRKHDGSLAAHHNVCPHRGRRIMTGCGKAQRMRCSYHGWTFDLDGKNIIVQDREDWGGSLDKEDISLQKVRVDTWGGFVFIDLRAEGESLSEFLETIPQFLGPYEYEAMRYRLAYSMRIPCNWKVAIEAFIEGYHVAGTHPQLLPFFGDDRTFSEARGKHSIFDYRHSTVPLGMPSPRLKMEWPADPRPSIMQFFEVYDRDMKALFSERDCKVAEGIMETVPEGLDAASAFGMTIELQRAAAAADGAPFPEAVTYEHMAAAGADWHIFPNFATLPWFDGGLCYRARPDGDDPDSCLFDIWSLVRYAPGKEPMPERRHFEDVTKESVLAIADQDIANMGEVQKGMKSAAFRSARPNPVQEVPIINFHAVLDRYLAG